MNYNDLKYLILLFRLKMISRAEFRVGMHLWQVKNRLTINSQRDKMRP